MSNRNVEKRRKRRRRRKVKSSVKLIAVISIAVIFLGTYTGVRMYQNAHQENPFGDIRQQDLADDDSFQVTEGSAKIKIFDVGQGEAVLIKSGKVEALIDTGTSASAESLVSDLKGEIRGSLDYLIITSPAEGRLGGIEAVTENFGVNTCILGEMGDKDAEIREKLASCGEVIDGKDLSLDIDANATLSVIKPAVSSSDSRDQSLITYFTFGKAGFVTLSDAGKEEISRAFGDIAGFNVIVLSRYGSEEPNMAIPAGSYNTYSIASTSSESGFPSETLADHLKGKVFATWSSGTLEFTTDGSSVDLVEREEEEDDTDGAVEDSEIVEE